MRKLLSCQNHLFVGDVLLRRYFEAFRKNNRKIRIVIPEHGSKVGNGNFFADIPLYIFEYRLELLYYGGLRVHAVEKLRYKQREITLSDHSRTHILFKIRRKQHFEKNSVGFLCVYGIDEFVKFKRVCRLSIRLEMQKIVGK